MKRLPIEEHPLNTYNYLFQDYLLMKKLILGLLTIFMVMGAFAQMPDVNSKIPFDPKTDKGVLKNGLIYYVRANHTPKNRAELMLVVSAGSILEDNDQQGLAHFCEHMSFNGTKNFPKNELINYFESIGMEFGPEINAYTGFDQTVYMLKVPLDSVKYMDKGLQVLYDWACQVTDSDDEINKERGVIHEEWRSGQGAQQRMMKQWLPVFFKDSHYADRLPIGKMSVVDSCPPSAIRRFRHDWYRPDLQAVIVVGDFDQKKMVQEVKDKFSNVPVHKPERLKPSYGVPPQKGTQIKIVTDPEATYSSANLYIKHPMELDTTVEGYREMMMHSLYNSMINDRLSEIAQKANPPFVYARSSYGGLVGPVDVYSSMAITHPGKIPEGLKAVLIENQRVKEYGFTKTELERAKASMMSTMQTAYNERDKRESIDLANEYSRNFLMRKEPVPGLEKEYEYYKDFMPTIKLTDVNALAKKWLTDDNRVLIITAPDVKGVPVPTENDIKQLLAEVDTAKVTPYKDQVSDAPLMPKEPTPGKIISEKKIPDVDAEEWTLSNGAKVILKKTDFKDDEILFSAYGPGGYSVFPSSDDVSTDFATTIMQMSGLSDFTAPELDKKLAGKVVSVDPFIRMLTQGFQGSSSKKDAETLMQLVNLYFTHPRFDQSAFDSYMTRMESQLDNRKASPEAAFSDTFRVVTSNYSPWVRPLTKETLKEANFDRIQAIDKDRFSNAGDFKFIFVGNIDFDKMKPLVETYLASLPSTGKTDKWKDLGIRPPKGAVEKKVYKGTEPKSIQYIQFHGPLKYDTKDIVELDALAKILTTRLLESIREDKSSVYYIGAQPSFSKLPEPEYTMTIYYGTDPKKIDTLKTAVFNEIKDLIKNGPNEEEVHKAMEKMLRERETNLRENSYWLTALKSYYLNHDGDFSTFNQFNTEVNALNPAELQKAAKWAWDFNNYVSVALLPEKGTPNK